MDLSQSKISDYLNETCELVKNKKSHSRIKSELESNIYKLAQTYENQGNSKAKSIDLALAHMGSSKKLGREINKEFKLSINSKLLTLIGAFVLLYYFVLPLGEGIIYEKLTFSYLLPSILENLAFIIIAVAGILIGSKIYFDKYKKLELKTDNINVSTYLNEICSHIKNKRVHSEVKKELRCHIETLIQHYKKLGHTDDEAIKLALNDMGNTSKLGNELNESHLPKIDFKLIALIVTFFALGILGSLTYFKNVYQNYANLIYIPLAILGFFIATSIDFKWYKKLAIPFYIFAVVVSLLPLLGFINPYVYTSASSFLSFIPVYSNVIIQPLLFLFGIAGIYLKFDFKTTKNTVVAVILGLIPFVLSIIGSFLVNYNNSSRFMIMPTSPMLFEIIFYGIAFLFVLYFNCKNIKVVTVAAVIEIAILGIVLAVIPINKFFGSVLGDKFVAKILAGTKFIAKTHQSSAVDFSYPNTGYPITNLIVYAGWAFGAIAILALLFFVFRLFKNSAKINNTFGKSLAFSITVVLSIQIILGILLNLNLLSTFTVNIPLISGIGFETLTPAFALGVLINITKVKNLSKI